MFDLVKMLILQTFVTKKQTCLEIQCYQWETLIHFKEILYNPVPLESTIQQFASTDNLGFTFVEPVVCMQIHTGGPCVLVGALFHLI